MSYVDIETFKHFLLFFCPVIVNLERESELPFLSHCLDNFPNRYGSRVQDSGRKLVFMELAMLDTFISWSNEWSTSIYKVIINLKEMSHSRENKNRHSMRKM